MLKDHKVKSGLIGLMYQFIIGYIVFEELSNMRSSSMMLRSCMSQNEMDISLTSDINHLWVL